MQTGDILVWRGSSDTSSGVPVVAVLKGHTQSVASLIIGASRLYSCSVDGTIKVNIAVCSKKYCPLIFCAHTEWDAFHKFKYLFVFQKENRYLIKTRSIFYLFILGLGSGQLCLSWDTWRTLWSRNIPTVLGSVPIVFLTWPDNQSLGYFWVGKAGSRLYPYVRSSKLQTLPYLLKYILVHALQRPFGLNIYIEFVLETKKGRVPY